MKLTVGRIVHFRLTERETMSKDRVGEIVPALVIAVNKDGTANLGAFLNGRADMPQVVQWEPEANRVPLILAPIAWVGSAREGTNAGDFSWPSVK